MTTHNRSDLACMHIYTCSVAQLCPTLCDPIDCSLPGSSVHGILQARILEWGTIPFSMDLPAQGSNLGLPNCRQILYLLSHQRSLRALCMHAKSFQSCPTLCNLTNCSSSFTFPFPRIKGSVSFPRGFPTSVSIEAFPQGCPTYHPGVSRSSA